MPDFTQARWLCNFPVEVPGQGTIEPGGIANIPTAEAETSEHWQPVKAAELEGEPKPDLVAIAERAGVDDPESKTKPELARAITKTPKGDS